MAVVSLGVVAHVVSGLLWTLPVCITFSAGQVSHGYGDCTCAVDLWLSVSVVYLNLGHSLS